MRQFADSALDDERHAVWRSFVESSEEYSGNPEIHYLQVAASRGLLLARAARLFAEWAAAVDEVTGARDAREVWREIQALLDDIREEGISPEDKR